MKCLAVLFMMVICCGVYAGDWATYRGVNHDGISQESDWVASWGEDGPKILWRKNVATGYSAVVVSEGKAYTMGNKNDKDIVFCLDAMTGDIVWKYAYDSELKNNLYAGGPNATPSVVDGFVYTVSKLGFAICLDAKSGKVKWECDLGVKKPEWGISGSPLVDGDLVFYNAGTGGTAVNKETGKIVWQNGAVDAAGYCSAMPAVINGVKMIILFGKNDVYAVEPASGKKLWEHPWPTNADVNAAAPIVVGNQIFLSSGYNFGAGVIEVGEAGVKELWKSRVMRNHMNSSIYKDGYVYGFDENQLKCVEFESGNEMWSERGLGKGSLTMAGDKLIVLSERGVLVTAEVSSESFKKISEFKVLSNKTCWTVPVIANGLVYLRNEVGDVACVDLRK